METEKTWYEITRFVEVIGVLHVRAVDVSVHLVHESSGTPVFVSFSKASHCLRGILCTAAGEHAHVAVRILHLDVARILALHHICHRIQRAHGTPEEEQSLPWMDLIILYLRSLSVPRLFRP